ncbi:MAG: TatD family hydrolase [Trebonia sp.]
MSSPNDSLTSPVPTAGSSGVTLPDPGGSDAHTHMDIIGLPVDGVLAAAKAAGIKRVVNVGCDLDSSHWSANTADEYDAVWAAVAIHPNETFNVTAVAPGNSMRSVLDTIETLARRARVVAIGETGLDYYRDHAPRDLQQAYFRGHIEIARRTGKALMIHDREAHEDVLSILGEYAPWPPNSVIFHCFSGDAAMAERCASAGYVMSFAGNVTFKNADSLREAARAAPAELMLAETDAPYLTPVPHRGKPNSPAMTAYTIRYLAALKNLDITDFCTTLQATGSRAFGW